MIKRISARGLTPALIVSIVLGTAFLLPGAASAAGACAGYGYGGKATAGISANPAGPQDPGTSVTLKGTSFGCSNPEYRFFGLAPGRTAWRMIRDYGSDTFVWDTTGSPTGTYGIGVWVRNVGSGRSYEAYSIGSYTLNGACTSANISSNKTSPQQRGTTITFTFTSTGCSAPRYQFWRQAPGSSVWKVIQVYGATNTYVFNSTGATTGPNKFGVWARQNLSGNRYDTYSIITFYLFP